MKTILRSNKHLFIVYGVILIAALLTIVINSKADTHLIFNSVHNSFFDFFFYYAKYLGDGVTALLLVIILLTVKYRYAIIVGLSSGVSALITQALKFTFDVPRPKRFFEGVHDLYFVPGVENYMDYSFPSGHTTCAFSLYIALALIAKQKRYQFIFLLLALFTGYSRIYLSQHFLEDVTAGSVIGTITAVVMYYWINTKSANWLNLSLIDSFRKSQ